MLQSWCRLGSSNFFLKVKSRKVAVQCGLGNVLGADVSWIGYSWNLGQCERSSSEFFLYPQIADIQMAYATEPTPAYYANGRRRVSEYVKVEVESKILGHGFEA